MHRYPGIRSDSDLYTFGYRFSRGPARQSPWRHTQDYWVEEDVFPNIDLDDSAFAYDYSGADATARRRTGGVT